MANTKYTIEEVKLYFKEHNCQLLSEDYLNNKQKLDYMCVCGNISNIAFSKFKRGQRCNKCGTKKATDSKRYSYEYVRSYFEKEGCELLEKTYKSNRDLLRYICSCGNESEIRFYSFKNGNRCQKCGHEKTSEAQKFTLNEVMESFESEGCLLLEDKYLNSLTKMNYICSCGEETKITYAQFRKGARCWSCGISKRADSQRLGFNDVLKVFEEGGCKLLSGEYINNNTPMVYECECGNVSTISLSNFARGKRCSNCKITKISGKNNYGWNPEKTDFERIQERSFKEYRDWRTSVFKRDDYTCRSCMKQGERLNAHHLNGYHWYKEGRTDIDNGVTLCEVCHLDFHKIYGKTLNTKKQYLEWIQNIKSKGGI